MVHFLKQVPEVFDNNLLETKEDIDEPYKAGIVCWAAQILHIFKTCESDEMSTEEARFNLATLLLKSDK